VPKTIIPVGNVGVVIFYTGPKSADVSVRHTGTASW